MAPGIPIPETPVLVSSLYLHVGWPRDLLLTPRSSNGMSLQRLGYVRLYYHLACTLSCCPEGSWLPCCELPHGEDHMARKGGQPLGNSPQRTEALGSTAKEELNPASRHMSELGSRALR